MRSGAPLLPREKAPRSDRRLKARLDFLAASCDRRRLLATDPVWFAHRYEAPADQEVAGLVAALLAFGNVKAVRASVARVLEVLGPRPSEGVQQSEAVLQEQLSGFVHRTWRGDDVARVLSRTAQIRSEHGGLGEAFTRAVEGARDLREGLARWADELRGETNRRSLKHLVADPRAGSACKRLLLYLRWMVRPADGVDLGIWSFSSSRLIVPLDTHVHRIARNLGLTDRKDASWRTAEEITARLRRLDPNDPVKYDAALCHLGISRACPSRRDERLCKRCVLKTVCVQWARGRS